MFPAGRFDYAVGDTVRCESPLGDHTDSNAPAWAQMGRRVRVVNGPHAGRVVTVHQVVRCHAFTPVYSMFGVERRREPITYKVDLFDIDGVRIRFGINDVEPAPLKGFEVGPVQRTGRW